MAFFVSSRRRLGRQPFAREGIGVKGVVSQEGVPLTQQSQHSKDSHTDPERRYFPRWEAQNKVLYQVRPEETQHECESKDLNCCGTCLITKQSLEPKQKLNLTIYLADNTSVEVKGNVLWSKPLDKKYLIGVNFYDTSKKIQDVILNHAFELKKGDLVQHWFKGWDDGKNR